MIFEPDRTERIYISRSDPTQPLASYSRHGFSLDGAEWPSVEHYYQAMKYEDADYREQIRNAAHPKDAQKLGKSKRHGKRKDWDKVKRTYMTRGVYTKCRTHSEVAEALLATGDLQIVESSLFDYYWGCGRDGRGKNIYGQILMGVREKLHEEQGQE